MFGQNDHFSLSSQRRAGASRPATAYPGDSNPSLTSNYLSKPPLNMTSHGVPRTSVNQATSDLDRRKQVQEIAKYKSLVETANAKFQEGILGEETLDLISKLLKWNPEYYTIWNQRRVVFRYILDKLKTEVVPEYSKFEGDWEKAINESISSDLEFLVPLLRKFPKCYWIWNYRLWLLQQATQDLSANLALSFWQQELFLASKMLSQDSRNFLAWGYRRTVVAGIENIPAVQNEHSSPAQSTSMAQQEFDYTTKMINSNLSNFSAWHHRSKVLPRLLNEKQATDDARRQALDGELELVERALYTGDNDQSPWFYHQYLMGTFDPRYGAESMAPNLSREERLGYVEDEIEKVEEMLDGAEDNKWIYQALIQLVLLFKELSGQWPKQASSSKAWIEQLLALDPIRSGKWRDLSKQLD